MAEVLAEYNRRWAHEFGNVLPGLSTAEIVRARDGLLMSVGPETGAFLEALVTSSKALSILELGTSFGHSTMYLAEAARATGGRVTSCDLDASKQSFARTMLARAGLDDHVTMATGDAVSVIAAFDRPVDFCLIDLWTAAYVPAFEALYPVLAIDGYVVADNMVIPNPEAAAGYRHAVRCKLDLESILLPIGWGLEVTHRVASRR